LPGFGGHYRLDAAASSPHAFKGQSAGRPLPLRSKGCGRGKSGLHRHTVPDNIRRGQPQGQCHRERTAFSSEEVRVKRCGKSAPRVRQRKRHGKPHREQNRIGTATRAVRASENTAGQCQARRPGRLLEAMCKHGPRGMAVTYRPRKRAVPYRTRLTGRLISLRESVFERSGYRFASRNASC
jgi:hypothetical protein